MQWTRKSSSRFSAWGNVHCDRELFPHRNYDISLPITFITFLKIDIMKYIAYSSMTDWNVCSGTHLIILTTPWTVKTLAHYTGVIGPW